MPQTTFNSALEGAGNWFLTSGIQEENGGVARYYRSDLGRNARLSTEITGYAVSALCYLHKRTAAAVYLDAAQKAAGFLVDLAWRDDIHIMPFEYPDTADGSVPPAYFFDSGIIVRGLLALYRIDHKQAWLDAAVKIGESMGQWFLDGDVIHPILSLPERLARPYGNSWSNNPGCYQLKSAMAWDDLYEFTGEQKFRRAYEGALAMALADNESFLPGPAERLNVMDRLHAYSYFLESILPRIGRPECAEAMRKGIERVAFHLRDLRAEFERSDVNAQLLRARLFADALGVAALDESAAAEEASWCAAYQTAPDGGFWFGRKHGQLLPYINPVSAAFSLQALEMYRLWKENRFVADRHELI